MSSLPAKSATGNDGVAILKLLTEFNDDPLARTFLDKLRLQYLGDWIVELLKPTSDLPSKAARLDWLMAELFFAANNFELTLRLNQLERTVAEGRALRLAELSSETFRSARLEIDRDQAPAGVSSGARSPTPETAPGAEPTAPGASSTANPGTPEPGVISGGVPSQEASTDGMTQ